MTVGGGYCEARPGGEHRDTDLACVIINLHPGSENPVLLSLCQISTLHHMTTNGTNKCHKMRTGVKSDVLITDSHEPERI